MIDKYNEVGISALEFIETANMAMTGNATAKPAEECMYPRCEDCINYHGHWCTVPMVISKQIYILINDKIDDLMKRTLDLEALVYDEILRSDKGITIPPETKLNFTWDDYLGGEDE